MIKIKIDKRENKKIARLATPHENSTINYDLKSVNNDHEFRFIAMNDNNIRVSNISIHKGIDIDIYRVIGTNINNAFKISDKITFVIYRNPINNIEIFNIYAKN
jgi:hypothetical protein